MTLIAEWFRDWKSPLADSARKLFPPYFDELAALKKAPRIRGPAGIIPANRQAKTAATQAA